VGTAVKIGLVSGLIAITEGIAIGRTFAAIRDYHIDGNKELIAFGCMNLCGSITSGYVTTGNLSFTGLCLFLIWRLCLQILG
jgi:MFS superfamily sulfate permease-like transporter